MKPKEEILKNKIHELVDNKMVPGVSYALIKPYSFEEYYYGTSDDTSSLNHNKIYDLASLTKVVGTTTRILQLIHEDILTLQTRVSQILKQFKLQDITIENLLLHNSGLPADVTDKSKLTGSNIRDTILNWNETLDKPGVKTVYSDIGYILLGFIIEKIDGDLSASVKKNIFEPMNMDDTSYLPPDIKRCVPTEYQIKRNGIIQGVVHDSKAYLLNGKSGSAGIFSTLRDLIKFTQMLLNKGKFGDKQIIPSSIFKLILSYHINNRTLGWEVYPSSQNNIYYHTGFTGTSILFDLTTQTGFILLSNRLYFTRENQFIEKRKELFSIFCEK